MYTGRSSSAQIRGFIYYVDGNVNSLYTQTRIMLNLMTRIPSEDASMSAYNYGTPSVQKSFNVNYMIE